MKQQYKYRTPNDADENEKVGNKAAAKYTMPSKTQQQFADDANINVIVHRFGVANEPLPPMPYSPDYYGNVEAYDLGEMLRQTNEANTRFNDLPARLRTKFANSPANLWDWIHDSGNHDEAVKLGLLQRLEPPVTPATPGGPNGPGLPGNENKPKD